ncbi:MAG: 1,4-alpha-glucan branching protein domain-containing protein [Spirochaetales bacterium]
MALLLNAHLPFVRHPEYEVFLEERWLFEALSETYLPLLRVFHRLEEDNIPFRLTMSFSPTLTAMLSDPLLQDRYRQHLELQLELAEKEMERTAGDPKAHRVAKMYRLLYKHNHGDFNEVYQGNVLRGFSYFLKKGHLELITTAATHAFLPIYQGYPEAVSAQIQTALESHQRAFGRVPRGIWLPECAYYPGLEHLLKRNKIDYFFASAHAVLNARDVPQRGAFAPLCLPNGVLAFPRDMRSTNAIWSHDEGYPSDASYRDFYRDIGFDLPMDYLKPYMAGVDGRLSTGFKYHAITGKTDQKVFYDPERAEARVKEHAANFVYNRLQHAQQLIDAGLDASPLFVCPFDAELFGHWWFEGCSWIEAFFRTLVTDGPELSLVTPGEVMPEAPDFQRTELSFSSWGSGGYAEVWLDGSNDWICRHTFQLVERMAELVDRFPDVQGRKQRALNQAAREVLLAQASDWPLILKMGTTVQYAERRVKEHIANFTKIYEALSANTMDTEWLTSLEKKDNLFPDLDYRIFRRLA